MLPEVEDSDVAVTAPVSTCVVVRPPTCRSVAEREVAVSVPTTIKADVNDPDVMAPVVDRLANARVPAFRVVAVRVVAVTDETDISVDVNETVVTLPELTDNDVTAPAEETEAAVNGPV
jgi:hypothetical protein